MIKKSRADKYKNGIMMVWWNGIWPSILLLLLLLLLEELPHFLRLCSATQPRSGFACLLACVLRALLCALQKVLFGAGQKKKTKKKKKKAEGFR